MKRRAALLLITVTWASVVLATPLRKKAEKRLNSASDVLQEIMSAPDKGIPEEGTQASAAAGPVGRHASAGTDWKLETEILSYARAKGAFVGVSLDGAWVRPDNEAMLALYGPDASVRNVLLGSVPPPASAHTFLAAVRSAELRAKKES